VTNLRKRLLSLGAAGAVLAVAGCHLLPASQAKSPRTLTLPASKPSDLIVITDPATQAAMRSARALLVDSAREGEHVVVVSDRGGDLLASSTAPTPPSTQAPELPALLQANPTSFQRARHSQALRQYQKQLQQAQRSLQARKKAELTSWAKGVAATAEFRAQQLHAGTPDVTAALGKAAADLASLRQSGSGATTGAAIVILSVSAGTAPRPPASLLGSTMVVADFPGTDAQEAAWQAALDQGGARRTVILTPAIDNQLTATVDQGLDGATADTLTSVLFGLGKFTLQKAASPQLRQLLHLLTATFPNATATIDGYTDSLPAPGGNALLSLRRAQQVLAWLVANKVPADRLEAVGCGNTDPVAPNTPHGQPLNRRVVVVIDPVAGSG
jgi:outer membrane protein OmpA-like peptidoglycan-associated protein